jgi:hypothetical protein
MYFLLGRYDQWLAEWRESATLFKVPQGIAMQQAAEHGYATSGVRGAVSSMIQEQLKQQAKGFVCRPGIHCLQLMRSSGTGKTRFAGSMKP